MAAAERTYSFRASGELGKRMLDAGSLLEDMLGDPDSENGQRAAKRVAHELTLALLRDRERFPRDAGNQSAFMRRTVERVVQTAEKVASDLHYAERYAEIAAERDGEFASGASAVAARRWRD